MHLLLLLACVSADAELTLGGAALAISDCETGERHSVTQAVALLADAGLPDDTLIVQDSGGSATVYVYEEEESLPGSGVYSYTLVSFRECGEAEVEARGYTSGGYAPLDGRFTLDCEVEVEGEALSLVGSGTFKGCR